MCKIKNMKILIIITLVISIIKMFLTEYMFKSNNICRGILQVIAILSYILFMVLMSWFIIKIKYKFVNYLIALLCNFITSLLFCLLIKLTWLADQPKMDLYYMLPYCLMGSLFVFFIVIIIELLRNRIKKRN